MKYQTIVTVVILAAVVVIGSLVGAYALYLKNAHSSFQNYYAFRGCVQLIEKTDTYGTCKTASGETIKIVEYNNKWYLDGDLPWGCFGKACFGW